MSFKFLLLALPLLLTACAHSVHMYDVNSSQSLQGEPVEARTEQFVIMGFVTQTDYVDQAFEVLKSKCQGGRVDGIQTRYSTSLGFFSWTNKIRMRGYCQNGKTVARKTSSTDEESASE